LDFQQVTTWLLEVIVNDAYWIVPVLLVLGYIFKRTPYVKDWQIPYALVVIGIILSFLQFGFKVDIVTFAIKQGLITAALAVVFHQLYIQAKYQEGE
jgi:Na+/glutamate symporter